MAFRIGVPSASVARPSTLAAADCTDADSARQDASAADKAARRRNAAREAIAASCAAPLWLAIPRSGHRPERPEQVSWPVTCYVAPFCESIRTDSPSTIAYRSRHTPIDTACKRIVERDGRLSRFFLRWCLLRSRLCSSLVLCGRFDRLALRGVRALALCRLRTLAANRDLLLPRRLPIHLFAPVFARRRFAAAALLVLALARNRHIPRPAARVLLVRLATRSLTAGALRRFARRILHRCHAPLRAHRRTMRCSSPAAFSHHQRRRANPFTPPSFHLHSRPSSRTCCSRQAFPRPAHA